MGDILEKIFAIILIVILIFFFPLLDAFERMDDFAYMTVYTATTKFVDTVRTRGEIGTRDYVEFMEKLNSTGNKYDVELVHRKGVFEAIDGDSVENIRLDDEFNTEQILYKMGYYEYDSSTNTLNETIVKVNYKEFEVGDYFYVSVQNTTPTPATVLKKIVYGSNMTDTTIMVPYGGMVQNTSK